MLRNSHKNACDSKKGTLKSLLIVLHVLLFFLNPTYISLLGTSRLLISLKSSPGGPPPTWLLEHHDY